MNCEQASAALSALIDGELTGAEEQAAREHLRGCLPCRSELEALKRIGAAYQRLEDPEPGPDIEAQVLNRFRQSRRKGRSVRVRRWYEALRTRPWVPAGWAFAGAAAVMAAIVFLRPAPEPQSPPVSALPLRLGNQTLPEPLAGIAWTPAGPVADASAPVALTLEAPVALDRSLVLRAATPPCELGIHLKRVDFQMTPDGRIAAFVAYETVMKTEGAVAGGAPVAADFAMELRTADGALVERLARTVFFNTRATLNGEGRHEDKFAIIFSKAHPDAARAFTAALTPHAAGATLQTPQ